MRIRQFITATLLVAFSFHVNAALVLLDRIAIIVDEDVIMQSEIEERIRSIKAQLAASPNSKAPPDEALQNQIVERLIVESLQLQMADRAGVKISDDELNQALNSIAAQNQLTLQEFRVAIERDGVPWVDMREQIRREMRISRVQQGMMRKRIQITEQEIKDFLASELGEAITADEFRLGHIVLNVEDSDGTEAVRATRNEAEDLIKLLREGADFRSMAVEFSDGQDALNGGDMGWRKPAQLPSMFAGSVEQMAVGDVEGPIKSGRGYHIIKLLEKRGAVAEGQIAQTEVRHVLIKPNEIRTEQESEDLANSLREEIVGGRSFDEVAKLYSDDPGSALSGGDLGWSRAGLFVPEFEARMNRAELNEVSEVFKTEHGYHFLEVTGRRVEDFSERFKMGQADNYLRNQKFDEELESWLREIREEAFVEVKI